MALSNGIVDSGLTILVLPIQVLTTQRDEIAYEAGFAFSGGVEDWDLLQCVLFERIDAHLNQNLHHLDRLLLVANDASLEGEGLREVLGFVHNLTKIDSRLTRNAHDFINVASLDFFKNCLLKRGVLIEKKQKYQ